MGPRGEGGASRESWAFTPPHTPRASNSLKAMWRMTLKAASSLDKDRRCSRHPWETPTSRAVAPWGHIAASCGPVYGRVIQQTMPLAPEQPLAPQQLLVPLPPLLHLQWWQPLVLRWTPRRPQAPRQVSNALSDMAPLPPPFIATKLCHNVNISPHIGIRHAQRLKVNAWPWRPAYRCRARRLRPGRRMMTETRPRVSTITGLGSRHVECACALLHLLAAHSRPVCVSCDVSAVTALMVGHL